MKVCVHLGTSTFEEVHSLIYNKHVYTCTTARVVPFYWQFLHTFTGNHLEYETLAI